MGAKLGAVAAVAKTAQYEQRQHFITISRYRPFSGMWRVIFCALAIVASHPALGTNVEPRAWPDDPTQWRTTWNHIPGIGFPLLCSFPCRQMPDYHAIYNPKKQFMCRKDMP